MKLNGDKRINMYVILNSSNAETKSRTNGHDEGLGSMGEVADII